MDPHRWNDDTPATGGEPLPRDPGQDRYRGQPHPNAPEAGPQNPRHASPTHGGQTYGGQISGGQIYGGQTYGRRDQTAPQLPIRDAGHSYGYGDRSYVPESGGSGRGPYPPYPGEAYPDQEERPRERGRSRSTIAVIVAFALVLALGATVWLIMKPGSAPADQAADPGAGGLPVGIDPSTTNGPSSLLPTTLGPTTRPPAPKPTPRKTTAKPRPTPTVKPPAAQKPPPPPAPKPTSSNCTKHPGPDASKTAVSAALASAGQNNYWQGVVPPQGAPTPFPAFSVPAQLMDAFAWTESSWQSTVVSCDGGIGLMQLMSDNVTYLNQRFDFSPALDVNTVSGNCQLGAAYIEWLTAYFGTYYFGSYDLMNATADIGTGGVTLSLLDVVIAAYNVGPDAVEDTHGTTDGSDDTLSIPNQGYVDKVTSAYQNQPWQ